MNNLLKHHGAGSQRRGTQCSCIGCIGLRLALKCPMRRSALGAHRGNRICGWFLVATLAGLWGSQTPCVHVEVERSDTCTTVVKHDSYSSRDGLSNRVCTDIRYEITGSAVAFYPFHVLHSVTQCCHRWNRIVCRQQEQMHASNVTLLQLPLIRWTGEWNSCPGYKRDLQRTV